MSNVKPGYKKGLIFGNWSEVISSVSRTSEVWFFDWNEGFADPFLKVSKSHKQISKFSFEPKTNNFLCISVLASKMSQLRKVIAHYHAN